MAKKSDPTQPVDLKDAFTPAAIQDSAQQIWQAGLGAFAKAQEEGSKAFEALVKEGTLLQLKTQAAAEARILEATSKMTSMASDISARATGQWDKLETIFEDRVAKALNKLGMPSSQDLSELTARVETLTRAVQALQSASDTGVTPTGAPAAKSTAKARANPSAKPAAKARTQLPATSATPGKASSAGSRPRRSKTAS
ncbi:MAG: hypothetical protein RL459_1710 [Pseudomonadota bacterium]|jgi:poly(hydroxyalkanoate) granule-associated protein